MNDDLVFVDEFVSGIRWDAKYNSKEKRGIPQKPLDPGKKPMGNAANPTLFNLVLY
jgi:hypothetical protein